MMKPNWSLTDNLWYDEFNRSSYELNVRLLPEGSPTLRAKLIESYIRKE